MQPYMIGNIYSPGCKMLNVAIDASLSDGLSEKLESVDGITWVHREDQLSDTVFTVSITQRADEEDVRVIRRDLDTACSEHIANETETK